MHVLTAVAGLALLLSILWDGFEAMVLPRRVTRKVRLSRVYIHTTWRIWSAVARRLAPGKRRDYYLSVYGPLTVLFIFALWAVSLVTAFALLYSSFSAPFRVDEPVNFLLDLYMSGTTFFTLGLGDVVPKPGLPRLLAVTEAGMGLAFLAIVLSYLPVLYQSFSRREQTISLMDARGGSPASAGELLRRHFHGSRSPEALEQLLRDWERWSAEVLESQISYPILSYFRSQHDNQSWLAALTSILDTCTLLIHGVGGPTGWQAQLTFAAGRHAVVDLAQVLNSPPVPPVPDRLPPADFERLRAILAKEGVDLARDPDIAVKIAELRAMYEPFVNSLAGHLLLRLPPWLHSGRMDNWRTSAWGRISSSSVLPLADLDDEHK